MTKVTVQVAMIAALIFGSSLASAQKGSDLMNEPECQGQPALNSIKFADEFFGDIRDGKKVATTRLRVRCYAAGSVIEMQSPDGTPRGTIKITEVSKTKFEDLTDAHARLENCTLKELQEGLYEIYGPDVKTQPLSFVEFKVP
jgi:uncharacterized protein YqfB (UPF0267 family)